MEAAIGAGSFALVVYGVLWARVSAYSDGWFWQGLIVESGGFALDIALFGVLLVMLRHKSERADRIRRYREELNDYLGWESEEGARRTRGLVLRLAAEGQQSSLPNRLYLRAMDFGLRARLSKANFYNANLAGAKLLNADLRGAQLSEANITGAELEGADFSEAKLAGADLRKAVLPAPFRPSSLARANLSGLNLAFQDLSGLDLRMADLSAADLYAVNFSGADLEEADLAGAGLAYADLRGALGLTQTQLNEAYIWEGQEAKLDGGFEQPPSRPTPESE